MLTLLPKYFKMLFQTGAGNGYGNFQENIVATSIRALRRGESKAFRADNGLVQRQGDNDYEPPENVFSTQSTYKMMQVT